jgi:hydrophobic/amphiphilic exporter-1 (mainly G- bacteria), HAE1 family
MSLIDTSIRRPVAVTMFYLVVITLGVVGFLRLPVDLLPDIDFPRLVVYVNYGNVGPEEMEAIITDPLENALTSIPNLERMTSFSSEGRSRVALEFGGGTDISEAANDVRAALDRLRDDLPLEADPPGIWKFDPNAQEIITLSVGSTRDLAATTRLLEREISQRFEQIPGVGSITIVGGVYREIQVQLRRDRLRAAGLTPADVSDALRRENVQLPGGNVREGISDLYIRTLGEYESLGQVASTIVALREGVPIRVRDVAEVVDGYEDVNNLAEVNGQPVVRLDIQKQSGANTVEVAARIRAVVDELNRERRDLQITIDSDQSRFIEQSISSVRTSAMWGGLLAVFVLYLFLRSRSTTSIVAVAIPISITATFGLLYFTGLTLNQMTFGGLALGIGMIVDNAIVVVENIMRQRREGRPVYESARAGTHEVAGAVVAATLTTCVIFLPVVFMRATSGQLFQTLALVVVFALACSLLVALTLIPVLASRFIPESSGRKPSRAGRLVERLQDAYTARLETALAHRGRVFLLTGALLLGAVLLWPLVAVELTPEMETDEIDVELEMARGTSIAVAHEYLKELEEIVREVIPAGDVQSLATEVRGDGDAEVEIRLAPANERERDPLELSDMLRRAVEGRIPGAEIRVEAGSGLWILRRLFSAGGTNDAIEVQLRGFDLDIARDLAAQIEAWMRRVPGIVEVRRREREGRPEQTLRFERARLASMGLAVDEVGRTIQTSLGGSRAGYYREGGEQFPITVRLRPDDRLTADDLSAVSVRTPEGQMVPVSTLVRRDVQRGPTQIRHVDGQRVLFITADLERGVALGDGVERVRAALSELQLPAGFSIVFGGAWQEQERARVDFMLAIGLALALVYMVMAGQFERFFDPLVVMFSIPVALIGVIPTLLLTGTSLNVQSVMGIVILVGIVVNNAILLVDYLNLKRRVDGMDIRSAAIAAGRTRLRPILMTTCTTVLGLLPLALGWGQGAGLQAALARVVVGGLLASTLVTLFLIPTLYVTTATWTERVLRARPAQRPAEA